MLDRSKCVILVPVAKFIEPPCEDVLRNLERAGYLVRRVFGYANVDQARSQMATDALADGFEELLWIDSDMVFQPDAVEQLRSHPDSFICGVYPKKGKRALTASFLADTPQVIFGQTGGVIEVLYAGFGFTLTRREVFEAVRDKLQLPICNQRFDKTLVPYFQPMTIPDGDGHWYLGEDFAFCHRAREAGFTILADTTIRLWHLGIYGYTWEDAGSSLPRYASYQFHLRTPKTE